MTRALLPFVAALTAALPCQDPVDLAALLEPIRAEHEVPALGVVVLVDGELAGLGATGVRRRGHDDPVTVDDRWHLGSCTKAMTATLLARQVAAGGLSWSTTVAEAMPDLKASMHESAGKITVAQLLQHRAGVPRGPSKPLWAELFRFEGTDAEARTAVAAELLAEPVTPGAGYLYSNAGYMIAGAIAERVDGRRDWQQLMRDELFAPLGMRDVGFGPPGSKDAKDQPWGHRGPKTGPIYGDNPPSLGPAGTVHATLRDWARFARLHLGVHDDGREPLLTAPQLAALHTPPDGATYALGWGVGERGWAPGPILSHSGSNTMWYCVAWLAPEADFAVLVTCNQGDAAKACDAVAAACIRRFRR